LVPIIFLFDIPSSSDKYEEQRRQWGGGMRGNKSTQMLRKRAKAAGQSTNIANFNKL
jgi:large subunit ribosomal protein L7Ae